MNNPDSQFDEMLEKYLDNQLSDSQKRRFEVEASDRISLPESIDLQARIDDSIKRIAAPPATPKLVLPSLASLKEDGQNGVGDVSGLSPANATLGRANQFGESKFGESKIGGAATRSRRRILITTLLSSAAALIWLFVGLQIFPTGGRESQLAFRPVPLTEVYLKSIDEGFQPYWVCEDPITFANTFENRQGVPLKLDELPANSKMLGLAYLGGLSRTSTSLLAEVDGKPVLVIVDRIENDWGPATGLDDSGIRVTRKEKFGLVFYEVSQTTVIDIMDYVSDVNSP